MNISTREQRLSELNNILIMNKEDVNLLDERINDILESFDTLFIKGKQKEYLQDELLKCMLKKYRIEKKIIPSIIVKITAIEKGF